ncbi:hypothetical protein SLA2020_107040 [Shorea laevis]
MRQVRAFLAVARYFLMVVAATEKAARVSKGTKKSSGSTRDTLGGRLVNLVYPKRSVVVAVRKWKKEGRPARKYEFNRIVGELRKLKHYKHTYEACFS